MKNTIKMSLVAALAVAGFSTTASAGGLEEAIKGVSISGKMEVEYDYENTNSGVAGAKDQSSNEWDIDWDMTAKVPVNDNITAVFGLEGDSSKDNANQAIDGKGNIQVTKTYFQYANGPVTAMAGKQGMAGAPWFDDERANGVVALYNAGPVTLAAAHFNGSNGSANGTIPLAATDISAAAVIGSMGPVNAQLWYANLSGITSAIDADSVVLMADAKFDIVNVAVKYGTTTYDGLAAGADDDAEMLQVVVSADLDMITPYAGYGQTDKDQAVAGLDLTNDSDSAINFGTEQLFIDDLDNAQAFLIGATMKMDAWKFDVSYVDGEYDHKTNAAMTGLNFNEFLVQVDYKMSKNFNIGAHYSTAELDTATNVTSEMDAASVSLEYKF